MNPLKWLMGGPDAAVKVLDAGVKAGDAMFHTKEEKAEHMAKMQGLFIEQMKTVNGQSSATSITRRVIAFMVIAIHFMFGLGALISWGSQMWFVFFADVDYTNAASIAALDAQTSRLAVICQGYINLIKENNAATMAVIFFYFGRHMVSDFAEKMAKK